MNTTARSLLFTLLQTLSTMQHTTHNTMHVHIERAVVDVLGSAREETRKIHARARQTNCSHEVNTTAPQLTTHNNTATQSRPPEATPMTNAYSPRLANEIWLINFMISKPRYKDTTPPTAAMPTCHKIFDFQQIFSQSNAEHLITGENSLSFKLVSASPKLRAGAV